MEEKEVIREATPGIEEKEAAPIPTWVYVVVTQIIAVAILLLWRFSANATS